MNPTASAKRHFEQLYEVDVSRGERCEVALDADGMLFVRVVKVAPLGYAKDLAIKVEFAPPSR